MITANERRYMILETLSQRRCACVNNLAELYQVTEKTIRKDIQILSSSAPIYTVQGKGGGIHVADGWYYSHQYLTERQEALLHKLSDNLIKDDFDVMQSILLSFAKPKPASQAEVHRTEYTAS